MINKEPAPWLQGNTGDDDDEDIPFVEAIPVVSASAVPAAVACIATGTTTSPVATRVDPTPVVVPSAPPEELLHVAVEEDPWHYPNGQGLPSPPPPPDLRTKKRHMRQELKAVKQQAQQEWREKKRCSKQYARALQQDVREQKKTLRNSVRHLRDSFRGDPHIVGEGIQQVKRCIRHLEHDAKREIHHLKRDLRHEKHAIQKSVRDLKREMKHLCRI